MALFLNKTRTSRLVFLGVCSLLLFLYYIPQRFGASSEELTHEDNILKFLSTVDRTSLNVLRSIQEQSPERNFHEGTHILYDLRSFLGQKQATYLEIGSYTGNSASLLLRHPYPTSVVAVDPCVLDKSHYGGTLSQKDTILAALSRNSPRDKTNRNSWELKVGFSPHAIPKDSFFDIIFIDGDHTSLGVWSDYNATIKLLRPGGFMVFDDYLDKEHSPEVRGAVDEIARSTELRDVGLPRNYHGAIGHGSEMGEYIFQNRV